jgi:hypothetical protein
MTNADSGCRMPLRHDTGGVVGQTGEDNMKERYLTLEEAAREVRGALISITQANKTLDEKGNVIRRQLLSWKA